MLLRRIESLDLSNLFNSFWAFAHFSSYFDTFKYLKENSKNMKTISDREEKILENIAYEAGNLLLKLYGEKITIKQLKGKHDFATDADIKSEIFIINRLKKEKLPYLAIGEEKHGVDIKFPLKLGLIDDDKASVIYIDPLEGTHNFYNKRGELGFGVTLGLVKDGHPVYFVFYNPLQKQLYKAIKNEGVYLNGKRIYVSKKNPEKKGEKIDIIFNHWPDVKNVGEYLDTLRKVTEYTPTSCSDAVDLLFVARGSADGLVYIFNEAEVWDMFPALGIEEGGGKVSDINGRSWYIIDRHGFMKVQNSMLAGPYYVHQMLFNLYNQ
jgi:myo-inositol-1(or 4)-monophosphatase